MQRFFTDFASIELLTRSLELHQSQTQCAHCFKHDQFVSHGIVYKQRSITEREPVGKRLFCSNRYGRSGCGRTVQLVIANCITHLRYSATVISTFITLLLAQVCVSQAYQQATGQFESRNAWRWINKFMQRLSTYRSTFKARTKKLITTIKHAPQTMTLILPTFSQMMTDPSDELCAVYQLKHQRTFM